MWSNPQFPADLVTFTEEVINGKLNFFCSISIYWLKTYDVEKIQPAANSEQIIKLVST